MDQTINISLEHYQNNVLQEISKMENYSQVEALISHLADPAIQSSFSQGHCIKELEIKIENLSPMMLNSTQWSCFRYALICLRALSKISDRPGQTIST